jgi:hypothetical protein
MQSYTSTPTRLQRSRTRSPVTWKSPSTGEAELDFLERHTWTLGSLKKVAKYKIGEYNRSDNGHIRMKCDNVYEYFPALHNRV